MVVPMARAAQEAAMGRLVVVVVAAAAAMDRAPLEEQEAMDSPAQEAMDKAQEGQDMARPVVVGDMDRPAHLVVAAAAMVVVVASKGLAVVAAVVEAAVAVDPDHLVAVSYSIANFNL